MVALGCGAGAVACIALAVHFRKRKQTGGAVAYGVVGGWRRWWGWLGLVSDDGIHQLLEFQIHGDRRRLENLCDTEDAVALHDDMGWLSRVGNGHWCVEEGKAIGTTILLARDNLGGKATDWSKCGEN